MYENPPCKSKEIKMIDKLCEIYNKKYLTNYFNLLNEQCVCSNCLVKMACGDKRLNCPEYLEFLSKVEGLKFN
jgi:hypothetical protein